jgi:hypothetical protein
LLAAYDGHNVQVARPLDGHLPTEAAGSRLTG